MDQDKWLSPRIDGIAAKITHTDNPLQPVDVIDLTDEQLGIVAEIVGNYAGFAYEKSPPDKQELICKRLGAFMDALLAIAPSARVLRGGLDEHNAAAGVCSDHPAARAWTAFSRRGLTLAINLHRLSATSVMEAVKLTKQL
jgi:hypothetical protein